jgi:hypothetical protein
MTADAAEALARSLRGQFAGFAGAVEIDEIASRRWASITFTGARHRLSLRLAGPGARAAADAFLDELGEREFELKGHVVADIALKDKVVEEGEEAVRLTLEALTVEAS